MLGAGALPGEGEQVLNDGCGLQCGILDELELFTDGVVGRDAEAPGQRVDDQLGVDHHRPEDVVQVVGDAAREPPHGLQTVRAGLLFQVGIFSRAAAGHAAIGARLACPRAILAVGHRAGPGTAPCGGLN